MIVLIALLLAASPVLADVPEPWQDHVLGMWFDEDATLPCINTTEPNQDVLAYVIVRHMPIPLVQFEVGLTIENDEYLSDTQVMLHCGLDLSDDDLDFVVVDCWIPSGPDVILMSINTTVIDPSVPVYLYLRAFASPWWEPYPACVESPCYAAGPGLIYSFLPASGFWDRPVAAINDGVPCSVVVRDEISWGAVKALYR